jgi:hypothetical protein
MQINRQLAPGLGDILPGNFVVPQNPITSPIAGAYVPHIGELMPGKFVVPQNPLLTALSGKTMPGVGCGCGSGPGDDGLGALDLSSFSSLGTSITDSISSLPWTTWVYVGGGFLLLMTVLSGGGRPGYRAAKREAMDDLRQRYPTRTERVQRAVATYSRAGAARRKGAPAA